MSIFGASFFGTTNTQLRPPTLQQISVATGVLNEFVNFVDTCQQVHQQRTMPTIEEISESEHSSDSEKQQTKSKKPKVKKSKRASRSHPRRGSHVKTTSMHAQNSNPHTRQQSHQQLQVASEHTVTNSNQSPITNANFSIKNDTIEIQNSSQQPPIYQTLTSHTDSDHCNDSKQQINGNLTRNNDTQQTKHQLSQSISNTPVSHQTNDGFTTNDSSANVAFENTSMPHSPLMLQQQTTKETITTPPIAAKTSQNSNINDTTKFTAQQQPQSQQASNSINPTIFITLAIACSLLGIALIIFIAYVIIYRQKHKQGNKHHNSIESPRLIGTSIPIARLLNIQPKIHRQQNDQKQNNNDNGNGNDNDNHNDKENNQRRQSDSQSDDNSDHSTQIEGKPNTDTKEIVIKTPGIHELSFSV